MPRIFERLYPYLLASTSAWLFWRFQKTFPTGQDVLSASITLGAVFAGFLATLNSMVIGLQGSKMKRFKNTQFFLLLLQYLKEAIWASLTFCALCLGGFFYDAAKPPNWFGVAWIFVGITTIFTFQRASSALVKLIRAAD